jgi:hypothetical protein
MAGAPRHSDRRGVPVHLFNVRNPFAFLFGSSRLEESLARYVLHEHPRGRPLAEILGDAYVRNLSSEMA